MCFAVSLTRINKAFKDLGMTELIDPAIGKEDYNIAATSKAIKNTEYTGYGVGGTLIKNGGGVLLSNDDIWNGKAQEGAALQFWSGVTSYKMVIEHFKTSELSGHSIIFKSYRYDKDGNIDGFDFLDYRGNRGGITRSLQKEHKMYFLGANLKE